MKPLAAWCKADYIQKEVTRVQGDQNRIHLEDGTTIDYDLLVLNVGSRSRGSHSVPGIWDHSLATRPINHLLASIEKKEKWLLDNNVTPSVAVCGAGAAGTELAFGYKARWSKLFNKDIPVTLISNTSQILPGVHPSCLEHTLRKLKEKGVDVLYNKRVKEVLADRIVFENGEHFECNVPVWATGAEAQQVTVESDLATLNGYWRVNDFL
jgi:selenide,water dikinase